MESLSLAASSLDVFSVKEVHKKAIEVYETAFEQSKKAVITNNAAYIKHIAAVELLAYVYCRGCSCNNRGSTSCTGLNCGDCSDCGYNCALCQEEVATCKEAAETAEKLSIATYAMALEAIAAEDMAYADLLIAEAAILSK
jgi:hypothetical protein